MVMTSGLSDSPSRDAVPCACAAHQVEVDFKAEQAVFAGDSLESGASETEVPEGLDVPGVPRPCSTSSASRRAKAGRSSLCGNGPSGFLLRSSPNPLLVLL